jgi:hypothetical protein
MPRGNNRYGAAGRRGIPAETVVAFLDHYASLGAKRPRTINGEPISAATQRSIRRWRNGQVDRVSERGLAHVLDEFGFDRTWFEKWAKLHRKPVA